MTSPETPEVLAIRLLQEVGPAGDLIRAVAVAIREAEERGEKRERAEINRILGFGVVTDEPSEGIGIVFHDPYYDLEGAVIDLERQKADEVCIQTIRRVQAKLAEVWKRADKNEQGEDA